MWFNTNAPAGAADFLEPPVPCPPPDNTVQIQNISLAGSSDPRYPAFLKFFENQILTATASEKDTFGTRKGSNRDTLWYFLGSALDPIRIRFGHGFLKHEIRNPLQNQILSKPALLAKDVFPPAQIAPTMTTISTRRLAGLLPLGLLGPKARRSTFFGSTPWPVR
jgi:hypothetical protein